MVLKPSEIAPITGMIFSEIMHAAGVPAGVYNMVNGDGPRVGQACPAHPDIDMMSFTGSTRAGILVAKAAADTVKRVSQELGGKSANIILRRCRHRLVGAEGRARLLQQQRPVLQRADPHAGAARPPGRGVGASPKQTAEAHKVGDPQAEGTDLGPVVSEIQFNKIQRPDRAGIKEGATLVTGGTGRPED